MTFVQIIDYETDRTDEMTTVFDQWMETTRGRRTASHETHMRDRENPTHFVQVVEFPSYEEAMKNNDLPETQQVAERMRALCTREPRFTNLEVVRDQPL